MKKLISISIVFIMTMLLLSSISYGELTSSTMGSIKVKNVEPDLEITIYQLTSVSIKNEQPVEPAYVWDSSVQTWINSNYPQYKEPENFYKVFKTNVGNETDITNEDIATFYSALAAAIKGGTVTPSYSTSGKANASGEFTFSNLSMGTYLVMVQNGFYVYRTTAGNLTPTYDETSGQWALTSTALDIEMKRSETSITKTVGAQNGTGVEVKDNYSSKDTIDYCITTDVPSYQGVAFTPTYIIKDELSAGLVLKADDTIIVRGINGDVKTTLSEETHYTITKKDINGTTLNASSTSQVGSFEISLNISKISGYEQIQVAYSCKLSQDSNTAIVGVNGATTGNTNNATLTYSNTTYDMDSINEKESEIIVYTYGIQVEKQDMDSEATKLANAEFTLKDASGNLLYFVGGTNGIYYLARETDTGSTTTVVGNNSGMLYLYGLDTGVYTLEETKAPAGYILPSDTVSITIADSDTDGLVEKDGSEQTSGVYSTTIQNRHGFQLPITGGIGTIVFAAAGIALVGLGIVFLVVVFKKKKLVK